MVVPFLTSLCFANPIFCVFSVLDYAEFLVEKGEAAVGGKLVLKITCTPFKEISITELHDYLKVGVTDHGGEFPKTILPQSGTIVDDGSRVRFVFTVRPYTEYTFMFSVHYLYGVKQRLIMAVSIR